MQVHRGWNDLPAFRDTILTIGTFDGVHYGHQQIIHRITRLAQLNGSQSVLLTFHPHPRLVLNPEDTSLKLLSTIEEKTELLEKHGIDQLIIATFSTEFASMEARAYVRDILVKNFHPRIIVIGYDHRFGRDRKGDIGLLHDLGPEFGFRVEEIPKQTIDDISVSSTKVRNALLEGNIREANNLLGYNYSLTGEVVHGEKLGRQLGFPTANLEVGNRNKLIPPAGVYAVMIHVGDRVFDGLLSIGYKPTLRENAPLHIEAFLLDFDGDLYGLSLKVEFIEFIRKEARFESLEKLKTQMQQDLADARRIFSSH